MLDKIRKLLIKQKEQAAVSGWQAPFHTEAINRSEEYQSHYHLWKAGSGAFDEFSKWRAAYEEEKAIPQHDRFLKIMNRPEANGFIIYDYPSEPHVFDYSFDLLKERVAELGYVAYNSDRRIYEESDAVKTIERYYLKPHLTSRDFENRRRQIYGNVLIELHKKDRKPLYLKFLSTIFADHKYEPALPFDELVLKLLR